MEERIERLLDEVARRDERSHVDAVVRARIGELVLQVENEPLETTASRLAETLPTEDLAAIVADWLDAQLAI